MVNRLLVKSDNSAVIVKQILEKIPGAKASFFKSSKNEILQDFIMEFESKEDLIKFSRDTELVVYSIGAGREVVTETPYSRIVVSNPAIVPSNLNNVIKTKYDPKALLPLSPIDTVFAIFIPNVFLTFTNPNVFDYKLFGADIYTDDSDVVAISIHTNQFVAADISPFSPELRGDNEIGIKREFLDHSPKYPDFHLIVLLQVTYPLKVYHPLFRNDIPSRGFALHDGNSITVIRSHKELI
eukprot:NODE_13_length_42895_cov_0.518413.p16 type:complete len:240 gc:universal NODE_13_length_42895_cov_0.518413:36200-36919(+)